MIVTWKKSFTNTNACAWHTTGSSAGGQSAAIARNTSIPPVATLNMIPLVANHWDIRSMSDALKSD